MVKSNLKPLHLKVDNEATKNEWVRLLRAAFDIYSKKRGCYTVDPRKNPKDVIPPKILLEIMVDQQKKIWQIKLPTLKEEIDNFLKIKKFHSYFDLFSPKLIDRHVKAGFIQVHTGKKLKYGGKDNKKIDEAYQGISVIDEESDHMEGLADPLSMSLLCESSDELSETSGRVRLAKNKERSGTLKPTLKTEVEDPKKKQAAPSKWKTYFAIMISQKNLVDDDSDGSLFYQSNIPSWMALDTLYLFSKKGFSLDSQPDFKIPGNQVVIIEPMVLHSKDTNILLILENRTSSFLFRSGFMPDLDEWLSGIRRIKKTREEVLRTYQQILNVNVDPLVSLFHQKLGGEIEKIALENCRKFTDTVKTCDVKEDTAEFQGLTINLVDLFKKARENLFSVI